MPSSDPAPINYPGASAEELDLRDYLVILRRHWKAELAIVGLVLAATLAYVLTAESSYRASATVLVRTSSSQSLFPTPPGNNGFLFRSTASEFEFARSDALSSIVGPLPAGHSVEVTDPDDNLTDTLIFAVSGPSEPLVAELAAAYATAYVEARDQQDEANLSSSLLGIETSIEQLNIEMAEITEPLAPIEDALTTVTDPDVISRLTTQRLLLLQTLEGAIAPIRSQLSILNNERANILILRNYLTRNDEVAARVLTSPQKGLLVGPSAARSLILAGLAGAIMAAALALLLENFSNTIRDIADLEKALPGLAVLATIPELDEPLPAPFAWNEISERPAYRSSLETLITSLQFVARDMPFGSLAIVAAAENTGKSTVAYSLALATAKAGAATILVDGDLHRPDIQRICGSETADDGLDDVTFGEVALRAASIPGWDPKKLHVLIPLSPTATPSNSWRAAVDTGVIRKLRDSTDVVIIDSPPLLAVSDGLVIGSECDAALLLVRANHTRVTDLREARNRLEWSGSSVAGLIFIGRPTSSYYY